MKKLMIRISKKTSVPIVNVKFDHRSEWRFVLKIDYPECFNLFKTINGVQGIETDAQFCKYLYNRLGEGTYLCLAWEKGKEGFWNFMKVELKDTSFIRYPKRETKAMRQAKQKVFEIRALKRQAKKILDPEARKDIEEQKEELEEDVDFERYFNKVFKKRTGVSPYLKSLHPLFKEHLYSEQYVPRFLPRKRRAKENIKEEQTTQESEEEIQLW